MVVVVGRVLHRGTVNDEIVGRIIEPAVRVKQQSLQRLGQILEHVRGRVLKGGLVLLGQNPGFKRKAWSIRRQRNKVVVFRDHAAGSLRFLPNQVAKDATLFVDVILLRALDFLEDVNRKNGQRNHLTMPVFERSARRLTVVLENQNVFKAPVFLEIKDAVAKSPQHVFNALRRHGGEGSVMVGGLNGDFVRADTIHLVEHALGLAIQIAFNPQGRKLVRDDAHGPARSIAQGRRTAIRIRPVGLNLGWSFSLVPRAEGAEAAFNAHTFAYKICGTLGAIGGNDHPPAHDWIFSKFGQLLNPFTMNRNEVAEWFFLRLSIGIFEQLNTRRRRRVFIVNGDHVETPWHFREAAKVSARHSCQLAPFFMIDGSLGGLHSVGSPGFDFNETEALPVPADEIDLPTTKRRTI